jgi:UPF0176 protein
LEPHNKEKDATTMTQPISENQTHFITAYYKFIAIENVETTKLFFETTAKKNNILGLIIIAPEGFNSTVSAKNKTDLENYKSEILKHFQLDTINFKDSTSHKPPFRRLSIKLRSEIVTLGTPELRPPEGKNYHLSPTEWNAVMKNERDNITVIDTRNWYETKIGTFTNAVNPKTDYFTEFPQFMESQNISKDKKVLIFCTGGIRCEKGILDLHKQGYNNVYQLDGGILNYLKEYPNDEFQGECFVFDHRVSVDQNLQPTTKYDLCPHCGQPAATEIDCKRCDTHQFICEDCAVIDWKKETCSKNCAHHLELHPDRKGPKQILPFEVE